MSLEHKALTEIIISDFYAVYNGLGYELLEKVLGLTHLPQSAQRTQRIV